MKNSKNEFSQNEKEFNVKPQHDNNTGREEFDILKKCNIFPNKPFPKTLQIERTNLDLNEN